MFQSEIFRLLCIKSGMSLNQMGIARILKVSEREGLIKVEKHREVNLVSVELNKDNSKTLGPTH